MRRCDCFQRLDRSDGEYVGSEAGSECKSYDPGDAAGATAGDADFFGDEAMVGLLHPGSGASSSIDEEGDMGFDSLGDEAMGGPLHPEF